MQRLDPRMFFFQNKDRVIRKYIIYYQEQNSTILHRHLKHLQKLLQGSFTVPRSMLELVAYYKSYTGELEKAKLNAILHNEDVKSILHKCKQLDVGDREGDVNRTMGVYIVEDASSLPSQILIDFNCDNLWWFSIEQGDHISELFKSTDTSYLNCISEIEKDAEVLKENLLYPNDLQRQILLDDFNRRWKGAVTATMVENRSNSVGSIKSVSIKDKLEFIDITFLIKMNRDLEEIVTRNANQTLFTLLLSHQRSHQSNNGHLRFLPKPLLQTLCRPGGLFWKANIVETHNRTQFSIENNKNAMTSSSNDNYTGLSSDSYCSLL